MPGLEREKILYLHEARVFGGGEKSLLVLIENLDRDKFIPLVACPKTSEFANRLDNLGINVFHIQYPSLKNIVATYITIQKIKNIVRQENISLIHANLPRTNFMGAVAARSCRIPVVWHERTLLEEGMIDINRVFSFLADRIICNSEAIRKRWLTNEKFANKTIAILNGVNFDEFNPSITNDQDIRRELNISSSILVVGMIGRLWPKKGHQYFIEAAAKVLKEIETVCFVIVGDCTSEEYAEYRDKLDQLIAKLKLTDKVIFLGFRENIPKVIAGLDILVLPSEVEGCARVLLEAMAMAKPVVATNTGGTPEIVADGQTGILVPVKQTGALTNALIKLLKDQPLVSQMGQQGRVRAEQLFSIGKNVAGTVAVYEELLSKRP